MNQLNAALAELKAEIAAVKQQIAQKKYAPSQPQDHHAYRAAVNERIDRIMTQLTPGTVHDQQEAA